MSEVMITDAVETGCGAVLRQAREKLGISLADAARQVKMRVNTLEALEAEQWAQIGAPVFIRGQLRSYGRLLNVDVEPFLFQFEPQQQPISHDPLAASAPNLSGGGFPSDGLGKRVVGVVAIVAAIGALAWWLSQPSAATHAPPSSAAVDATPVANVAAPVSAAVVVAAPVQSAADAVLALDFSQESWVQISAPDGKVIEQGVVAAGEHRGYKAGDVGKVVLGKADAIVVQQKGAKVDTTPFQRANVARFTVSSDGSLAAAKE